MADDTQEALQLDKLVAAYIKIRDKKEILTKELEAEIKLLDDQLDTLKAALLNHCKENGVEGGKTTAGTFTRTVKTRYWTNDWVAMHAFILEHKVPEFLEKRIQQTNIKQFMEDNPDVLPPGLNTDSEYVITVRRSR